MNKIMLLSAMFFLLFQSCSNLKSKDILEIQEIENSKKPIEVYKTAEDLYVNYALGTPNIANKIIQITGDLQLLDEYNSKDSKGNLVIGIKAIRYENDVTNTLIAKCYLSKKNFEKFKNLKTGDRINIKGRCYSDGGSFCLMDGCTLL